jgi:hypothetical protein
MKRKYEFQVRTWYINSTVKDVVELEFDDNATEEEIEKEVEEVWIEWRNNNCEDGFNRVY